MKRGEIWWANMPDPWGRRPVLLLARDEAYEVLSWVTVAPLTTAPRRIPSTVSLDPSADGVALPSIVTLDHILSVRTSWLERQITTLNAERMREVDRAIHFALNLSF
jgi:mRNA interferase MazF